MSLELVEKTDFSKGNVPAIVQDVSTGQVLMLAYMNREALKKTIETGYTWFYSRSRGELWNKGETSGNKQKVKSIKLDCDSDTLLLEVEPMGPACHTGRYSCFYKSHEFGSKPVDMLYYLEKIIKKRLENRPEGSYVVKLSDKGENSVLKKLGEESAEMIMAVKDNNRKEIVHEGADLIFHLLLSLEKTEVSIKDLIEELESRHQEK